MYNSVMLFGVLYIRFGVMLESRAPGMKQLHAPEVGDGAVVLGELGAHSGM